MKEQTDETEPKKTDGNTAQRPCNSADSQTACGDTAPQKICGNCRYFLAHYVKAGTRFHKICAGHCICNKYSRSAWKKSDYAKACAYWEPMELQKQKRLQMIAQSLEQLERHLSEMTQILRSDLTDM